MYLILPTITHCHRIQVSPPYRKVRENRYTDLIIDRDDDVSHSGTIVNHNRLGSAYMETFGIIQ